MFDAEIMKDRGRRMDDISLQTYAKVNLTLDIMGRRKDGYHLLESVMQSVSLSDLVIVRKQPAEITISTDVPHLPTDQRNICWQAADAFFKQAAIAAGGAEIEIKKRIPIAAGLGGGSSNAAAVLIGLNKLFNTDFNLQKLQEIGLSVGADVPFCLQGGTALVQGIGETVTPLAPLAAAGMVLVKPEGGVSTAQVYKALDPNSHGSSFTRQLLPLLRTNSSPEALGAVMGNALETAGMRLVPEAAIWKRRLLDGGAAAAVMSGSGPTVFGLFADRKLAERFSECWKDHGKIYVVKPVQYGVRRMNGGDQ